MDEFLQQVVDNMRKNEFEVVELRTAQEACDYLNEHIDAGKTVGVGGSVSVRATGILEKLQEKGYFAYGGSTVILLLEAGRVALDEDILRYSAQGIESRVRTGERIGEAL